MNVQVTPHRIILTKTSDVNSGEYNVNECTFEFSQEFDNLTCIAVFSLCDGTTRNITILNNRCIIPTEVLQQTGQVKIGVYGYSVQDDELVLRYSPTPQIFVVTEGSYKEGTEPVAPSPTDWEILVQQVSNNSRDISNIEEDITGINGEISGINIDIRDLQDTKANINDLASVAFSGSYTDLINKPDLSVYATKTDLSNEETARENADINLQNQIDAISVSSDVVDVVGTYQELLDYDTQHLKDNDIVKVLDDSTHNDALSYYRWDKEPQTWSYIGSEGPFYTKGETQELLNAKEDKITTTNKLDADLVDDSNSTNKFVTEEDITYWDNKEDKSNKVTEINSSSTDTEYPSAKCVYDSQEVQNEEIDTLKMIYNILPTDTDTGETISIDNTGEMLIKSISLGGNTSQVVIPGESGTNVNATSISISDVNTSKEHTIGIDGNTYQEATTGANLMPVVNVTKTVNGITLTNNENGTITLNGTATAQVLYPITNTGNNTTRRVPVTENDYKFMLYGDTNVSNDTYFLQVLFGTETETTKFFAATDNGATSLHIATDRNIGYGLIIRNGQSFNNHIIKPMGVLSTYTGGFEPFTNGASPNPSYPQNIEVVTGENTIVISNSDNSQSQSFPVNLGNIELCKISTYKDRIYKSNDKWYLEKQTGKVAITTNDYITHYSIWHWIGFNKPNNSIMRNNFNNYELYMEKAYYANDRTKIYSYNTSIASEQMGVMCYEDDDATILKQKLDGSLMYYPLATPTTTEITDTTLVSQLNALYNSTLYSTTNINTETSNLLPYIDLQYNVVTPSPSPSRPSVVNVVKGNNTITISNSDNTQSQTYPINLGTLELCKIGTYQDYIYKSGGNWYKHSEIGKVVLDGTEEWESIASQNSTTTSWLRKKGSLTNALSVLAISNNYLYSDKFAISNIFGSSSPQGLCYHTDRLIQVRINNSFLSDTSSIVNIANSFISWLSQNKITLYYILATPTDTQITDTTLINQLNNLEKAYSYDTQTNISQTNEDKPFIITAEMFLSLKNVLN